MRSACRGIIDIIVIARIAYSRKVCVNGRINAFHGHVRSPVCNKADNPGISGYDDEEKEGCFEDFDNVFLKAVSRKRVVEGRRKNSDEKDNSADRKGLADKKILERDNFIDDKEERVVYVVADFCPVLLAVSLKGKENRNKEQNKKSFHRKTPSN